VQQHLIRRASILEIIIVLVVILAIFIALSSIGGANKSSASTSSYDNWVVDNKIDYFYIRKDRLMTPAEVNFFKRLEGLVRDKYYVFPQVHLSSLVINKIKGKYYRAAFQKINHKSVDYALVDKKSFITKYAIELDDSTHDTASGRAADKTKKQILFQAGVILVRFRNPNSLNDDEIIRSFQEAHQQILD
jgi:very-short-patch-repair endonuclease